MSFYRIKLVPLHHHVHARTAIDKHVRTCTILCLVLLVKFGSRQRGVSTHLWRVPKQCTLKLHCSEKMQIFVWCSQVTVRLCRTFKNNETPKWVLYRYNIMYLWSIYLRAYWANLPYKNHDHWNRLPNAHVHTRTRHFFVSPRYVHRQTCNELLSSG